MIASLQPKEEVLLLGWGVPMSLPAEGVETLRRVILEGIAWRRRHMSKKEYSIYEQANS
jgi:hypothetical protein